MRTRAVRVIAYLRVYTVAKCSRSSPLATTISSSLETSRRDCARFSSMVSLSRPQGDLLFLPPAFAGVSVIYLSCIRVWSAIAGSSRISQIEQNGSATGTAASAEQGQSKVYEQTTLQSLDGSTIFAFRLLRLLAILALLSISVFELTMNEKGLKDLLMVAFYVGSSTAL